jgi:flagellar assembly protein FliH
MEATTTESFAFPFLEGTLAGSGDATAPERAAAIIAEAHESARAIARKAAEDGYASGYAAGIAQAGDDVERVVVTLELACSTLAATIDERVDEIEHRAAEVAVALAEKILAVALELEPGLVAGIAAGVLRGLTERDHVVVEVNPDDVEIVRAAREDLVERLGGFTRVEVVPERRVPRGGVVVQTLEGEVDGRPSVQLERAMEVVRDVLAGKLPLQSPHDE